VPFSDKVLHFLILGKPFPNYRAMEPLLLVQLS
jgi:hypothetical protein